MKKVLFTSILLLSAVSFGGNIYAQDTAGGNDTEVTTHSASQPSVKFTADGNTLTISGQGDLTSYMTTDWSAKVFTDKAVGFVFTDDKGTKVNAKDSYNSGKTYYEVDYKYKPICDGGLPKQYTDGFDAVNTSFDGEKIANLYQGYYDNNGNIVITDKVTASSNPILVGGNATWDYEGVTYSPYFTSEFDIKGKTISMADLETEGVKLVTKEALNNFLATTYKVTGYKSLFVKHADSKEKIALVANNTYTYQNGDLFYEGSATYAAIEDNKTFFGLEHTNYLGADDTPLSFNDLLARKILEGVKLTSDGKTDLNDVTPIYETVKFVNEGTEPLVIGADVVRKILYPLYNNQFRANVTTKTLDLGDATIKDLSSETFVETNASWLPQYLKLENLTLPLTLKTSVFNEDASIKEYQDKMVVPSDVLIKIHDCSTLNKVVIPTGYENIANEAFQNLNVANFELPTTIRVIGDKAFFNCNNIASIELNEGLVNIGVQAFNMGERSALRSVKLPTTLKIVKDGAFLNCKIYNLKLNAGLEFIGNTAFGLPAEQTEDVLEIPASVKYIGPFAFNFRQYQDVYFYGAKAPLMPLGDSKYIQQCKNGTAFTALTLMGNGGFNKGSDKTDKDLFDNAGEGYANRENFRNTKAYFCILHYPKELSDDNRATYNDITKVYETAEEGKTFYFAKNNQADSYVAVGQETKDLTWAPAEVPAAKNVDFGFQDTYLGRQYIWPSQEQWLRSYIVSSNGYNWNGVDEYRPELTKEELETLAYAGYEQAEITDEKNGKYTLDDLKKIAHLGTRQFVLANADVNEDKEPEKEPEYPVGVKGGEWWTLCLPFNMTKKMVDDTFGEDTQVCLFDRVVRQVNRNTKKNRIVLYFTQNVYKHKTEPKNADGTWNFQDTAPAPADGDIVIYAHESYMIHPTKTGKDAVFAVKNYQPVVGNPTPTVVMGKNEYTGESDTPDNVPYRYVGNYLENVDAQVASQSDTQTATQALTEVKVPKFSYVYASDGKETKFWFLTSDDMTWKPNKCVVQTNTRGDGQNDYEEFFDYTVSSAKQSSFFGEDFIDTPTSIEDEMVIIAGEGSDAPVYSLDGTLVNTTGDLTGLPKGVYIKGGKKYVVK